MALNPADHLLPRLNREERRFTSKAAAETCMQCPILITSAAFEQVRYEQGTYPWKLRRWYGFNASDAECARDKFSFKRRWEWFAEKVAPPPLEDAPDPLANNPHVRRGKFYEDVAAALYERQTGNKIIDFGMLMHHKLFDMRPVANFTIVEWSDAITMQLTADMASRFIDYQFTNLVGLERAAFFSPLNLDTLSDIDPLSDLWEFRARYVTPRFLRLMWHWMCPAGVDIIVWDRVFDLNWILGSVDGVTTDGYQIEVKVPATCIPNLIKPEYETQIQINAELLDLQGTHFMQYDAARNKLYIMDRPRRKAHFAEWYAAAEPVWRQVQIAHITGIIPQEYQPPPPKEPSSRKRAFAGMELTLDEPDQEPMEQDVEIL